MRLTERVHLVASGSSGVDLTDRWDANGYLIDGGSEAALVDAGCGQDPRAVLAEVEAAGVDPGSVRALLLTHGHPDHAGGAGALRRLLPRAEVAASPGVARWLRAGDEDAVGVGLGKRSGFYPDDFALEPCPVGSELDDGALLGIGDLEARALATPGHADGHLCFLLEEPGGRSLLSGDCLFWGGRISLLGTPDCRLDAYRRSLRRLRGLAVDALLPGHHQVSVRRGQRHVETANRLLDNGFVPPSLV